MNLNIILAFLCKTSFISIIITDRNKSPLKSLPVKKVIGLKTIMWCKIVLNSRENPGTFFLVMGTVLLSIL